MNFIFNQNNDIYDDDEDVIIDDVMPLDNNININNNINNIETKNKKVDDFRRITNKNLYLKNSLLKEIDIQTKKLDEYFFNKLSEFPKIFTGKNFSSLPEVFNYLQSISIPTKCVCAGIIDNIPGWKCEDCSIYENSIYCSKCYFNSKEFHKNHKVEFSSSSSGMCDCGDPDALYSYCPEHCGPYTEQKQYDEYINKVFPENILKNITIFLDDLFYQFTKYLLLTEKCKLFYDQIFEQNDKKEDNKIDILNLKNNFSIIFKNFINFLRKITEKNDAMLHIIASYFLKNNLIKEKVVDNKEKANWNTTHTCIKFTSDNIKILFKDKNANKNIFSSMNFSGVTKHECECPFIRLFISNYRSNIKSYDPEKTEDEKFFLSFNHNLFLRKGMCVIIFFLYKEMLFNNSDTVLYVKNQYYIEDALNLIVDKSNLIEDFYEFLYDYVKIFLDKNKNNFDLGIINKFNLNQFVNNIKLYMIDSKYFTKPKIRKLMFPKIDINKKLVDIMCLFHYQLIFKSIVPHPEFQIKKQVIELVDSELFLLVIANILLLCIDWENFDRIKEIFNYFVDKILYLNKNSILGKDEFTYHIPIYKYFGAFINSFCFNYAIHNNTNIIDAIEVIKNKLFRSKEEMNKIISIILDEYYKYFGFVIGIRNGFFNYYELHDYNFVYYNDRRYLTKDLVLLKYLFAMMERPLDINYILEKSNVENVYSTFKSIFDLSIPPNSIKPSKSSYSFFNFFKHPISSIQNFFFKSPQKNIFESEYSENNFAIQWRRILETIIVILKNDSMPLIEILTFYDESISIRTKNILFEKIKKNKYLMHDCRYILKQNLIQNIIANGNLMDLEQIQKVINDFYFNIFDQKEFNEILEEVTFHKINEEKKQFYIKDSALKYLDMNYYYSPMIRSKAEIYISDFKKDVFKMNNSYYYSPSEMTFDLYNKAYKNFFLKEENIQFFKNILQILLEPEYEERMKSYDANSIRAVMIPIVFDFLSMFGCINSTEFYNFKLENENLIQKICNILNGVINMNKENKENKSLDSELEDNIVELIKKLNSYKTIKGYITDGILRFNNKSYNNNEEELKINIEKNKGNIPIELDPKKEEKKNKIKNMKNKLKNSMKKKSDKFMDKAKKDKKMKDIINTNEKIEETSNKNNEEIMCFYCRNPIHLNNYDKPYGKLGLSLEDYFYHNSMLSTINSELNQINENVLTKEKSSNIIKNMNLTRKKNFRINSCGHYFHESCFKKGKNSSGFKCPLCEKVQNILIPPLNNFYNKSDFLKPLLKLKDIFSKECNIKNNNNVIIKENFKDIVINFFEDIKFYSYSSFFEDFIKSLLPKYQSYTNFLVNLIYCNAITFYKHQQIVIIKNLILSIRYLIYINKIDINHIIYYIQQLINEFQLKTHASFQQYNISYYKNLFDELLICFSILFDYDELKNGFIFLIYLILPYICFFMFIKNLVIKNNFCCLSKEDWKEKISSKNLKEYLKENNTELINNFQRFLHKFYIIKLTTSFDMNDDNNNHNLKNLSLEQLFSLLNMENIYQSLSKNDKNEIIFSDLLYKIPELFSSYDYYNKDMLVDYDIVFNSMINQNNKIENESSKLVESDLILQFLPYEFKLISLDNEIFDFFEKYIFEKCCLCNKEVKYYFICLICGKKICASNQCDKSQIHVNNCCGTLGMFIYINDMKLYLVNSKNKKKQLFPLYVNESGVGPNIISKGRDYKLSKEKYETALKEYISLDIKL